MNNPVNMTDSNGNLPTWNDFVKGAKKAVEKAKKTVNAAVNKLKTTVNKVKNYFSMPSKEEHYARNDSNPQFPEKYDPEYYKGWDDTVAANCHQFTSSDRSNKKYVSGDGRYEVIYDSLGNLVSDVKDVGTYNFVSPNEDAIGHFIKDVVPWVLYGNAPGDTTTMIERIGAFVGVYGSSDIIGIFVEE